ncbi:MAG TPA: hypothetical protein VM759_04525, partial [Longimicrobium sp.]|nr:hypothetical protein [Longimicrobium sp.]
LQSSIYLPVADDTPRMERAGNNPGRALVRILAMAGISPQLWARTALGPDYVPHPGHPDTSSSRKRRR